MSLFFVPFGICLLVSKSKIMLFDGYEGWDGYEDDCIKEEEYLENKNNVRYNDRRDREGYYEKV